MFPAEPDPSPADTERIQRDIASSIEQQVAREISQAEEARHQRAFPRVEGHHLGTLGATGDGDLSLAFYLKNFSSGGVQVEVDRPFAVEDCLTLRFAEPGTGKDVQGLAVVCWCQAAADGKHRLGLRFVSVDDRDNAEVIAYLRGALEKQQAWPFAQRPA